MKEKNNDLSYSNKGVTLFLCYVKLLSNTILLMAPWPQDVIAHSPLQNTAVVRKVVGKRTKVHATILRGIIWVSNNNNSSNPWCLNFIVMFYQISLKSWGQVTLTLTTHNTFWGYCICFNAVFLTHINSYIHMKCIQKTGADKNNSLERKIDLTLYYIIYI